MDETDKLLRALGHGLPFDVDWPAYQREVLRRVTDAANRRQRQPWIFAAAGMAAGIAATLLIALPVMRDKLAAVPSGLAARPDAVLLKTKEATPLIYLNVAGKGSIQISENAATSSVRPAATVSAFVQKTGRGEIRFDGFSALDSKAAEFMAITKPVRKQPAHN